MALIAGILMGMTIALLGCMYMLERIAEVLEHAVTIATEGD
jgi:ABC-type Mn2+/Zn2+ transport system permease subunit